MVSWPTLIAWRIWSWLTWWPWQVHQMKRSGFRHTGWMRWEIGGPGHHLTDDQEAYIARQLGEL
jgi:hypothetical protein